MLEICLQSRDIFSVQPNLYQILEIGRHDTPLQIRQAYKKVSRILHPDKNLAPNAEEQFQAVKKAYDVKLPTNVIFIQF